ncbi:FAD:protein FMN transferase [Opitutus terrae]|uniref:FAD:protein FMN transferase n=1 Tax=Opitutus terrae (strain DSM 11246 / JCM 15787 / PB90-1) TaxID=452637 RepID=B1ZYD5_OPITP|nr:FAD:protein FMN transferase [Opitutus terrae]ACB77033.1 ApbE family lipoprotein [Opitutus terrae PB90-1]
MSWFEFQHEAMATTFAIAIADQSEAYAKQAATAAWREIDRLESELSRYVQSSDIARANRIARGETIAIGEDALQCLLLAAEFTVATRHAFDPAYASRRAAAVAGLAEADPARAPAPASTTAGQDSPPFTLDPDAHTLTSHIDRLHLDLGAIGKGYALDGIGALLREWEIPAACLQSGGSSVLALAAPTGHAGWPIGLGDEPAQRSLALADSALSGSGIAVKGVHLQNPRTGRSADRTTRVWALANSAAASDALSTAFFVMSNAEIAAFCADHPEIGAAISTADGQLLVYGRLAG